MNRDDDSTHGIEDKHGREERKYIIDKRKERDTSTIKMTRPKDATVGQVHRMGGPIGGIDDKHVEEEQAE